MKRILGIDTGTNSLGWAVVDFDESKEENQYTLIRKGCLLFQEGVKIEKGIESSRASDRTIHRAARRHYFRRRLRKIETLKVLIKYGWCPYISDEALKKWHLQKEYPLDDEFLKWQRTDDRFNKNPYYYRHLCLHQKLDLSTEHDRFILGRAMYHLAQRRGFLSNRLDQTDEKESGKVKAAISDLSKDMKDAGCEYLGDYFYKIYSENGNTERIRNKYTHREEHYEKEFDAICKMQGLSELQIEELRRALYFQRPLKSQRQGVGKCTFERNRNKPRCSDSHPAFERFRMLCLINNIKVKSPYDTDLRPLSVNERALIEPLFYRKGKGTFDFEDIAKKIAGKNNYKYFKDKGEKGFSFNYRMTQGVSYCPTTRALMDVFGSDYATGIAEVYTLSDGKTLNQIVDDVWNVLFSFADDENLRQWGKEKLQLSDEKADEFVKIRLSHNYASLSLHAIRKILPWLEEGLIYSHAVMMAQVPTILGLSIEEIRERGIERDLIELMNNYNKVDSKICGTLEDYVRDYLSNNFELKPGVIDTLYHPSMIETYRDAEQINGVYQLGSPQTNSIRNPMAMRSLHELRKVINSLLREKVIDQNTEVHIEYARELNDANKRAAIARWQREREKKIKDYAEIIKSEFGIEPTELDLMKYELWEEQGHICLYTGKNIALHDFICEHPKFDIEHTIPRSAGGDFTMENLTLCDCEYNRYVKQSKIPAELGDYDQILSRVDSLWKDEIEKMKKDVDKVRTYSSMAKNIKDGLIQKRHFLKMKLDYLQGKYERFLMKEVPEGFSRRQGAGIGLVGKYAGLFLKSLFHDPKDTKKSHIVVVKGATTAEFRKMWGIQSEYEKKSRDNHIHHCIDAIVIACMSRSQYAETARYYHDLECYSRGQGEKPRFKKPWAKFTEDILALSQELLVKHDSKDNLPKQSRKRIKLSGGKTVIAQGDTTRCSLHQDTFYGAIEKDGEIKYVVRRPLSSFTSEKDIDKIVDDSVRAVVRLAFEEGGIKALSGDVWLNREKGVKIAKVRCYASNITNPISLKEQRDISDKDYKRSFYVANDSNYIMAIYEGVAKGKIKRDFTLVNNITAAKFFKKSAGNDGESLVSDVSKDGYPLKWTLRTGQHVLLYEKSPDEVLSLDYKELAKRLYYVSGLSTLNIGKYSYGIIILRFHQESRMFKDLKIVGGEYVSGEQYRPIVKLYHSQFKALVEGFDFEITELGEIKLKR